VRCRYVYRGVVALPVYRIGAIDRADVNRAPTP
jgi:hypothetical protein